MCDQCCFPVCVRVGVCERNHHPGAGKTRVSYSLFMSLQLPCYDPVLFGVGSLICSARPSKAVRGPCVGWAARAHRSGRRRIRVGGEEDGERGGGESKLSVYACLYETVRRKEGGEVQL